MNLCVVEDNRELLKNLVARLDREPDMAIIGSFSDAETAVSQCDWPNVTVLLADIELPGMSGVKLMEFICPQYPNLLPMAYTICDDRQTVFAALKAGAFGYILKGAPIRELTAALRQLQAGGSPMSPAIARFVIRELHQTPAADAESDPLTERELEILQLVAEGLLYKEIAERTHASIHTVHTHIKRIYHKLHAHGRQEAIVAARQAGLLTSG